MGWVSKKKKKKKKIATFKIVKVFPESTCGFYDSSKEEEKRNQVALLIPFSGREKKGAEITTNHFPPFSAEIAKYRGERREKTFGGTIFSESQINYEHTTQHTRTYVKCGRLNYD